jgi:hypothetical protein
MAHDQTIRSRHPFAWDGEKLEANLSAVQRDAQGQARSVLERDLGTEHDSARAYPVRRQRLELPQLRLVGDCR